jgi:hypothetical protein
VSSTIAGNLGHLTALDKEIRLARADLARLEREYGAAAADNAEQRRPTMRGFKIAHGGLGKQLRTARKVGSIPAGTKVFDAEVWVTRVGASCPGTVN